MNQIVEVCTGCGHSLSWHFNDVTGVARCLVVSHHVSTKGILGIPWEEHCPCANFQSPPKISEPESTEMLTPAELALQAKLALQRKRPQTDEEVQQWAERLAHDVANLTD